MNPSMVISFRFCRVISPGNSFAVLRPVVEQTLVEQVSYRFRYRYDEAMTACDEVLFRCR